MLALAEAGTVGHSEDAERLLPQKSLLVIGHTYQPPREALLPAIGGRIEVVPHVNEGIYAQCYRPVFVDRESLPQGFVFSFYASLRDWFVDARPQAFQGMVEKINALPDKEYQVLGDPCLHVILPLQPKADQDMLIKIGKRAFEDDFGFSPKGLWLPETAVSHTTLEVAAGNGYEFVVLRSDQLQRSDTNPVKVQLGEGKEIAIVHFNLEKSGRLSFVDKATENADQFLDELASVPSDTMGVASDTELYGHHKKFRDLFLERLVQPDALEQHGFAAFDVKAALQKQDIAVTDVWDYSSWTCEHGNLGRWTGECGGHGESEGVINEKRYLYRTLTDYGAEIDRRLDNQDPDWRSKFIDFFLANRRLMFGSSDVQGFRIEEEDALLWAKYCELVGKTSCGLFFSNENSPERDFPRRMIQEIEFLIPDIAELAVFESRTAA